MKTCTNNKGRTRPLGEKLNQVKGSTGIAADPILRPQTRKGGERGEEAGGGGAGEGEEERSGRGEMQELVPRQRCGKVNCAPSCPIAKQHKIHIFTTAHRVAKTCNKRIPFMFATSREKTTSSKCVKSEKDKYRHRRETTRGPKRKKREGRTRRGARGKEKRQAKTPEDPQGVTP